MFDNRSRRSNAFYNKETKDHLMIVDTQYTFQISQLLHANVSYKPLVAKVATSTPDSTQVSRGYHEISGGCHEIKEDIPNSVLIHYNIFCLDSTCL